MKDKIILASLIMMVFGIFLFPVIAIVAMYMPINEATSMLKLEKKYIQESSSNVVKEEKIGDEKLPLSIPTKRNLKNGEIYGEDVIKNYISHKEKIENGDIFFELVTQDGTFEIHTLEELKKNIYKIDIFEKSFTLDEKGNLASYKYKRVLE